MGDLTDAYLIQNSAHKLHAAPSLTTFGSDRLIGRDANSIAKLGCARRPGAGENPAQLMQ